jgi:hypothetical protein
MASGPYGTGSRRAESVRVRVRYMYWPKHRNICYFFCFKLGTRYHIFDDSTYKYSTYRINLYVEDFQLLLSLFAGPTKACPVHYFSVSCGKVIWRESTCCTWFFSFLYPTVKLGSSRSRATAMKGLILSCRFLRPPPPHDFMPRVGEGSRKNLPM